MFVFFMFYLLKSIFTATDNVETNKIFYYEPLEFFLLCRLSCLIMVLQLACLLESTMSDGANIFD